MWYLDFKSKKLLLLYTGGLKTSQRFRLYISSDMKAIKNVFIWLGRRDPYVCFEYRSASEQQVVAMIFVKQSGYQILRAFRIYETGRSVFFIVGLVFVLKQLGLQLK